MKTRPALSAAAVTIVLAIALGGCSSHVEDAGHDSASAAQSLGATADDIAFAQLMIPHHEQAVEMADLALDPQVRASPQVRDLAEQIKGAQDPEIRQMEQWLGAWGAPSRMPGSDDSGMPGHDMSGHDMGGMAASGMMTAEDMAALAAARGADFDRMWLRMMIAHHQGAVQMAGQVKTASTNADVVALANQIIAAQNAEIQRMQQYLAS